jgi:hypothetical protein
MVLDEVDIASQMTHHDGLIDSDGLISAESRARETEQRQQDSFRHSDFLVRLRALILHHRPQAQRAVRKNHLAATIRPFLDLAAAV